MRLLLDTHSLLWSLTTKDQLSETARREITSGQNIVFVSMASLWEIRIKESLKKISLPKNFHSSLLMAGYDILGISLAHIEALRDLPLLHRDPFDRMLIVQSQVEQLTLITRDAEIAHYKVNILKA